MLCGYPGSGKTGALASLANAGFKIRILDFDGNLEPLIHFTKPECLGNIDAVTLEDKLRMSDKYVVPVGIPRAFADGLKLMDHWKYTDADGEEVDLGHSKDWGRDTVLVLDSLTSMGLASKRRAMVLMNKNPGSMTDAVWGTAMAEQEAFIEKLTRQDNRFHIICLSHLKIIGPKEVRKGDDDITMKVKKDNSDLVETRLFPSALGRALPPFIGGHFPTLLLIEPHYLPGSKKVKRVIQSVPRPELDLTVPAPDLPENLDISDGLVKVFDILTGGVEACLKEAEKGS
jgi:hypothetical protein